MKNTGPQAKLVIRTLRFLNVVLRLLLSLDELPDVLLGDGMRNASKSAGRVTRKAQA
jgi:hypothetical protein